MLRRECLFRGAALVAIPVIAAAWSDRQSLLAAQPTMSQQEIDDNSDAIAVVDVLGVACQEDHGGGTRRYMAWVMVREAIKGDLRVNETQLLMFTTIGQDAGGIHVVLHPGERVRVSLHQGLIWHQDGYRVLRRGPINTLPTRVGEVSLGGYRPLARRG